MMRSKNQLNSMLNRCLVSSFEFAAFSDKDHNDVMREIEQEIDELGELSLSLFFRHEGEKPYYDISKKGVMQLLAKIDTNTRYKLVEILEKREKETKLLEIKNYRLSLKDLIDSLQ